MHQIPPGADFIDLTSPNVGHTNSRKGNTTPKRSPLLPARLRYPDQLVQRKKANARGNTPLRPRTPTRISRSFIRSPLIRASPRRYTRKRPLHDTTLNKHAAKRQRRQKDPPRFRKDPNLRKPIGDVQPHTYKPPFPFVSRGEQSPKKRKNILVAAKRQWIEINPKQVTEEHPELFSDVTIVLFIVSTQRNLLYW